LLARVLLVDRLILLLVLDLLLLLLLLESLLLLQQLLILELIWVLVLVLTLQVVELTAKSGLNVLGAGNQLQWFLNGFRNRGWGGQMGALRPESVFVGNVVDSDRFAFGWGVRVRALDDLSFKVLDTGILQVTLRLLCLTIGAGKTVRKATIWWDVVLVGSDGDKRFLLVVRWVLLEQEVNLKGIAERVKQTHQLVLSERNSGGCKILVRRLVLLLVDLGQRFHS
jgi:hypothetical protein